MMHRKLFCLLLALMLLSCRMTFAESTVPMVEVGVVTPLDNGALYDLDGDGQIDDVRLDINADEDGYAAEFTFAINGQEVHDYGVCMNDQMYALRLDEVSGTMVLVSEYGPSDDPLTHFYLYEEGRLNDVGNIEAMPDTMRVMDSTITAPIRGKVLYTWFHDADFALARGVSYDADGLPTFTVPHLHIIPRFSYPMSLIVTLKVDLPLYMTPYDDELSATLSAGSSVILCASDDVKWVYLCNNEYPHESGWLELADESGYESMVNGTPMVSTDVFDGLFLAD